MNHLDALNQRYPVRRTDAQKESFRKYILGLAASKNIKAEVETTSDKKNKNIVIGNPLTAKVVCTAHYDTPAASLFPNIMIPRNILLFWLYQFTPVLLILAVSLGLSYLVGMVILSSAEAYMLLFLVIYYGLYFVMYRIFKNPNNYNDNTSGVAAVLSIIDRLDEKALENVAFILFDNEEKGKKGSKAYFNDHKDKMKERFLVNFDCVGNGEHIIFIAMENAEKKVEYNVLRESFAENDTYKTYFYPIKGSESNSDYKNFPCGVGCMACKQTRRGIFYTPRIHTPKDVVASDLNIEFIADRMVEFFRNSN